MKPSIINLKLESELNQAVTTNEKIARAKEIGIHLSNNNKWKSHGRPINIEALKNLRLEIDGYSIMNPVES